MYVNGKCRFSCEISGSFSLPGVEGGQKFLHILPWDELRLGIPHVSSGEAGERKLYISKEFLWGLGWEDGVFRWGSFFFFWMIND